MHPLKNTLIEIEQSAYINTTYLFCWLKFSTLLEYPIKKKSEIWLRKNIH